MPLNTIKSLSLKFIPAFGVHPGWLQHVHSLKILLFLLNGILIHPNFPPRIYFTVSVTRRNSPVGRDTAGTKNLSWRQIEFLTENCLNFTLPRETFRAVLLFEIQIEGNTSTSWGLGLPANTVSLSLYWTWNREGFVKPGVRVWILTCVVSNMNIVGYTLKYWTIA